MKIQEKCQKLNQDIHNKIFYNNYLLKSPNDYKKVFTSLDVIEDSQDAIDEFKKIPEESINARTTLYIYGVLQSIYCQQDGLFYLYKTLIQKDFKNIYSFFLKYNFSKEIREVRDDIAGHPADRNRGKEFYYITKGTNSKYKFSYAGYSPEFRTVNVDLRQFLNEQSKFTKIILVKIENHISDTIQTFKNNYKMIKLVKLFGDSNRSIQLINRGINETERGFQAEVGINEIVKNLSNLQNELNNRYNNEIPDSLIEIFKFQEYILTKIKKWFDNKELLDNFEAKIFMDSFKHQNTELIEILKEIDTEFEN